MAGPSRAQATAKPDSSGLLVRLKLLFRASTAPLMTLESNPNRNPPTAATIETRIAFVLVAGFAPLPPGDAAGSEDPAGESVVMTPSRRLRCRYGYVQGRRRRPSPPPHPAPPRR